MYERKIKIIYLSRPSLFLGEQDWKRASFQTGVFGLIQLIIEGRLRHARGPAAHIPSSLLHTYLADIRVDFADSCCAEASTNS